MPKNYSTKVQKKSVSYLLFCLNSAKHQERVVPKFCFLGMENKEQNLVEQEEYSQDWKRSIPAQIFLNYFFSLHYLIRQAADAFQLNKVDYFRHFRQINAEEELSETERNAIQQHLLNAWNTEYALRATAQLGNDDYLRNALHWTFPQACYSVFESLQAFLRIQGIKRLQPEQMEWEAGHLVANGAYPKAISFYASGHPLKPHLNGLQYGHYRPSLQLADMKTEAQAQLGQFLRTTRKAKAQSVRQKMQGNPATALRSQRTGKVLARFTDEHWRQLSWKLGHTSIFSFLLRLRISANHREITRFVEADIDFRLFQQSLQYIVSFLNFVHEAYVAKALGLEVYRKLVQKVPPYLQEGFVQGRLKAHIAPLFAPEKEGEEAA
jgi:hypothetical protein